MFKVIFALILSLPIVPRAVEKPTYTVAVRHCYLVGLYVIEDNRGRDVTEWHGYGSLADMERIAAKWSKTGYDKRDLEGMR